MKKLTGIIVVLALMLMMVSSVMAIEIPSSTGTPDATFYKGITLNSDGQEATIVDESITDQNLFQKILSGIFGGQDKNFVDTSSSSVQAGQYSCNQVSSYGPYHMTSTAQGSFGLGCKTNQFTVFKYTDGRYIFDQAWKVSSSSDYPQVKNYYIYGQDFDYSYACYTCSIDTPDNFEKGCITSDRTECVSASDSKCYYDYGFEGTCLSKIVNTVACLSGAGPLAPNQEYCWTDRNGVCETSKGEPSSASDCQQTVVEPKISIQSVVVENNGNLVSGENYEIVGVAYVEGTCNGCVIETGLNEYGQSFSVAQSSTGGACGDDRTVGIRFNAKDEYVRFTLRDTATQSGRYRVPVYASNGCYNDLGSQTKLLDTQYFNVLVEDPYVPPKQTTCYGCVGTEPITQVVIGDVACPSGYYTQEISCQADDPDPVPTEVTCYYCYGSEVRENTQYEFCDSTTTSDSSTLNCGTNPPPQTCEGGVDAGCCSTLDWELDNWDLCHPVSPPNNGDCSNDVYAMQNANECNPPGWNCEDLGTCPPIPSNDYTLYYIIGGIVLVFAGFIFAMNGKGGKKK